LTPPARISGSRACSLSRSSTGQGVGRFSKRSVDPKRLSVAPIGQRLVFSAPVRLPPCWRGTRRSPFRGKRTSNSSRRISVSEQIVQRLVRERRLGHARATDLCVAYSGRSGCPYRSQLVLSHEKPKHALLDDGDALRYSGAGPLIPIWLRARPRTSRPLKSARAALVIKQRGCCGAARCGYFFLDADALPVTRPAAP
jgi:hypothetical protein